MRSKESKIPLLLTLVLLGYFAYWAVGYVARNKKQPAPMQPIVRAEKPAIVDEVADQKQSVSAPPMQPAPIRVQVVPKQAPTQDQMPVDEDAPTIRPSSEKAAENRKIMGIIGATNGKH
jgi:hypothetical protein